MKLTAPALLVALLAFVARPAVAQVVPTAPGARPAQAGPVPMLRAARAPSAVRVDGRLDELAWASAAVASDAFTQSYPQPGGKPTQRTEVRVLYDDDALYVGARLFDMHPDSIAAQLARRDATGIYSDWLHVVIDSYHDRRTAFRFSVNPSGVQKDVFHSDDTNEDLNWDAVWQVATRVDSLGWTAEYRIPFSQLRFGGAAPGAPRTWGLQLQRDIARNNERDSWAPWTRNTPGFVSRSGDLAGLVDVPMPQRLELLPYASARLTRAPGDGADPFYHRNDVSQSVGADLKYGLPGGLTLSATINPDFGQVEVDPAVVNLSAFETFFPEKRPFFVEGARLFDFGRVPGPSFNFEQLFYSRRIGRAPQRGVGNARYADVPGQSTILGAAKVTGKAGPWTLGFINAVTGEEQARVVTDSGRRVGVPVEPRTNYLLTRVRRDLRGGNTVVGGMATATNRDLGDPMLAGLLRSHAVMGGLDLDHLWADRRWELAGYVAGTSVGGRDDVVAATQRAPARYYQRPDADYLDVDPGRRSLSGYLARVGLQRRGAFGASLGAKTASPGFEVNDLGFQGRVDYRSLAGSMSYNTDRPWRMVRNWNLFAGTNNAWNFGGDRIWTSLFGNAQATFNNLWSLGVTAEYDPSAIDDRLTRGGPVGRQPTQSQFGLFGNSAQRHTLSSDWYFSYATDEAGGESESGTVNLVVRPSASIRVSAGPALSRQVTTNQYVTRVADPLATATYGARYVFANLRQTTLSAETRVDWTFTTRLSLQLYAQPFISAGSYGQLKELAEPGTLRYGVYGRDLGTVCRTPAGGYRVDPVASCSPADGAGSPTAFAVRNPDFNVRSLRGNAVMRWEYRPGSALFFVWQQERSGSVPEGDFGLRRDVGALFRERPTNVFLVKATFWAAR